MTEHALVCTRCGKHPSLPHLTICVRCKRLAHAGQNSKDAAKKSRPDPALFANSCREIREQLRLLGEQDPFYKRER